ncbi:hypothetical protein [Streptomyces roseicoloratus]|uniref:hypothetical protein n=1 Tax=Streptomyces roseicoloratus TaxID=2508722 RepID=UPI001009AC4D|nr:hypothetical protein [Streptomyces roseicoloratus]
MQTRTLPRAHTPGWAHPYGRAPFSPVFYADGGDGAASGSAQAPAAPAAADPAPQPTSDGQQPRMYDAAYVDGLRKEAAQWRTKLRESEQAQEARFTGLMDQLKAAGIKLGDKPDAEQLQASLTAAQSERREALLRAALYETASEHGANPSALRDSVSFLESIKDIDPTDSAALVAAAKAALTANPTLSAAPAGPARGGADLSGGGGNEPRQLTEDDLSRMTPEQIVEAQDKGLLRNLLGG